MNNTGILSVKKIIFYFLLSNIFIIFYYLLVLLQLVKISIITLKRTGNGKYPCFVPNLRGKLSKFHPTV